MAFIRKKIKKDGTPSWRVVFKDQYGERKELAAGSQKKTAELLKNRIEQELAAGTFGIAKPSNPLLSDFCKDFLGTKKNEVKASTIADCERVIRNHIEPLLGDLRLSEITPTTVREFLNQLQLKGLSAATVGKVYRYLKMILRYGLALEIIDKDPTQAIRPPRVEKEEMEFLTPVEINKLLEASEGALKPLLATACFAGLRQGEILGLKWKDIDWDKNIISVVRSYHYAHGFNEPKTAASRRAVPMVRPLQELLKEHYASIEAAEPEDLVFPNSNRRPQDRRNLVSRDFEEAIRRAGIKKIRFHDLRHTYAALCIAARMDPKAIQRTMGHASIKVTFDTYGHLFPGSYDSSMERLEELIGTNPRQ